MISPLKRNAQVFLLSMFILVAFFFIMEQIFSTSVAIKEQIVFVESDRYNVNMPHDDDNGLDDADAGLAMELFEHELQQRKLDDPADSREQKPDLKAAPPTMVVTPPPTLAQRLKAKLKCQDHTLRTEKVQHGQYWVLRNFVRGTVSTYVGCADTITYTTIGEYPFFDNLPRVVERWLAPISFAIFAPGYDMNATMDSIAYVRNCLPESELIRQFVTFHIYFPANHMPWSIPRSELEAQQWPHDCFAEEAPYESVDTANMYRLANNLTYPINVGRNIARKAANTHFILASDIELYPSPGLARKFLELVERNATVFFEEDIKKRVYPLPVFEIEKKAELPQNKTELVKMLRNKTAIVFHAKVCSNCHRVPGQADWENATDSTQLSVSAVTKREGPFVYWEPFYISDNLEPMFDERVTWEGQSNKRIQGYAMCLLGYEYHILHPAFLVHKPGIKYFDKHSPRLKYVPPMNKLIKKTIQPEYKVLYGRNNKCRT